MTYIITFIVGGLLSLSCQILLDYVKWKPTNVMTIVVLFGILLEAVHLYEPIYQYSNGMLSVFLIHVGYTLMNGIEQQLLNQPFISMVGLFSLHIPQIMVALIIAFFTSVWFSPKG
ncbi:SpoVA/SpoVAEb family sporulation membrane protein [Bacillus salinus]|uniref:SpoVA/SpoVAEb family sporulation membrane protein n=1 Tax=Bacillus sp. HMF5848 TaxID=2495421 RepID=UPI00163A66BA|nr:SpoVA/SpoVAEb family sporulation membrane protein [Bacillus sp. HMF5848]